MGEKRLRLIFYLLASAMLIAMLVISRDAGISGDEELHYKQSELVYNYFKTCGNDKSSLYTPKTHLQYYGQIFDNVLTVFIHWFNIEDVYTFRHLMCSIAGWLAILITGLFTAYLAGFGPAIVVLLLFAVSPTFLGHAQNNLKDIPFALAYISSIYFSIKIIFSEKKFAKKDVAFLILSIALAVGIRAGGLLVIFYFAFFFLLKILSEWFINKNIDIYQTIKRSLLFLEFAIAGYLGGLILWPYALQNPLANTWQSYEVMAHFPTTVRQIFEGNFDWSDFHPWYYLPKYMAITIPIIVFIGIALFLLNFKKQYSATKQFQLSLVGFTIVFPIIFVLIKQSNLYGSWRHFLFIYPGIILLAALGIYSFLKRLKKRGVRVIATIILVALVLHPVRFMAANHPYYYLYYNELVGGLKGAYGNYETDYYYHTMRQGVEWLQNYLKDKPEKQVIVGGNFPAGWFLRNDKNTKFLYFPWQERSLYDWDYAVIANSYIPPYQLKNKIWPPENTIYTILADGVPVCAVVKRTTKDDWLAIDAQMKGDNVKSALLFENALKIDPQNEFICYKFAETLLANGNEDKAKHLLISCLQINPGFEKALVLLGDVALKDNDKQKAVEFYSKTIGTNRKYYQAYVKLAKVYVETDVEKARHILRNCLKLNAKYKPALETMADTYRGTDPQRARKYEELILRLK
jgi:predicted Zn-dependent protease